VQGESTVKQVRLTFNGLKWNAMTNMSGDSAGLSKCEACSNFNWRGPSKTKQFRIVGILCYGCFARWDEI